MFDVSHEAHRSGERSEPLGMASVRWGFGRRLRGRLRAPRSDALRPEMLNDGKERMSVVLREVRDVLEEELPSGHGESLLQDARALHGGRPTTPSHVDGDSNESWRVKE